MSQPPSKEQLEALRVKIEGGIRLKARRAALAVIADCLGSHDIVLLSAMGIDGKERVIQIFNEECHALLNPGE